MEDELQKKLLILEDEIQSLKKKNFILAYGMSNSIEFQKNTMKFQQDLLVGLDSLKEVVERNSVFSKKLLIAGTIFKYYWHFK